MVKQNNGSHKVILGLAISTAVGASILYYLKIGPEPPQASLTQNWQNDCRSG